LVKALFGQLKCYFYQAFAAGTARLHYPQWATLWPAIGHALQRAPIRDRTSIDDFTPAAHGAHYYVRRQLSVARRLTRANGKQNNAGEGDRHYNTLQQRQS
jgi:hypothetical protein